VPKVIKRSTKGVTQRFKIYDGPEPTPGVYRGIIKKAVGQMSSGGNIMLTNTVELEALPGDKRSQFDGYPAFARIVWGDHDTLKEREQAYYLAIAGKEDADVAFAGDPTKFKAGDKQETPITKVGGKNPVGAVVLVRLKNSGDPEYPGLDTDGIYPTRDVDRGAGKQVKGQTKPIADEEEEDLEDEEMEAYDEDTLKGMSLAALRKILTDEFDEDKETAATLKSKAKLIAAILEAQEADLQDDDEDLDDDEEEEDDEEDDREAEIDEQLEAMDRNAVKAALKKRQADRTFKKSESDDDLKAELKELMLQDPPF
jgi:hypothetical protein